MHQTTAYKMPPDSPSVPGILGLIRLSFAYMEPRINPPSSMHRLTVEAVRRACDEGKVWAIGDAPDACLFLEEKEDALTIGKLAVRSTMRGRGLARTLINLADDHARAMGKTHLELETRIELTENHTTFRKLGFAQVATGSHPGFDRPTFVIMRKPVAPPQAKISPGNGPA